MRANYVEEVFQQLQNRNNIRNISVIAHVDHGKTTLVDSLLAKAGIIKEEDAGRRRILDTKQEEQDRGITIKSTGISLLFNQDKEKYLINLVDSPGHVDFSSEVTAALRITDGALVVVDCVEGVCVQTETVIGQALSERIRPVLHVNKVDIGILKLQLTPEALYQKLDSVINGVNQVLDRYQESVLGDIAVDPRKGTVCFGSGKQGWAFTLPVFARKIAAKTKRDPQKLLEKLWGEWYLDTETGKITQSTKSASGKDLERAVCALVFKPLINVFLTLNKPEVDLETCERLLKAIDSKLAAQDVVKIENVNDRISKVLQNWVPAGDALVEMIVKHLPSPIAAQKYRYDGLYTGPLDDETAQSIKNCDPNGPVVMYVSKMIPTADGKRFYAFGRLFSGTMRPQVEVKVMGAKYVFGESVELDYKRIPRVVLMMGKYIENIDEVPCGNTLAVLGLDNSLQKSGTLSELKDSYPITPMKFSVSPVVRVAVQPTNLGKLSKFVAGLKRLRNSESCLLVQISESGESVIAGAGELHVEVALNDLREFLGPDVEFTVSQPVVEFSETISKQSIVCLAKSANKHNRLYVSAEPLDVELCKEIENGTLSPNDPLFSKILIEKYGWDVTDAKKIWFWKGTNCFVDQTRGLQYLNEIKDHVLAGFEWVVKEGVMCGEPVARVRWNFVDAKLHPDAIHRGAAQITPPARQVCYASLLAAEPKLMEPIYLVEVQTELDVKNKVYSLVNGKRGFVFDEEPKLGTPLYNLKANLPVLESFGFNAALQEATGGRAFTQLLFSHFEMINSDFYDLDSLAGKTVKDVRKRKKMKEDLPKLEDYNEKL